MTTDKRVVKTRKAITEAFMKLSLEKDVRKITVSDIAERAIINRSTFYLHYGDAKEVLEEIERNITAAVYSIIYKFDVADIYGSLNRIFIALTSRLDNHLSFKNFMLYSTASSYVVASIKKTLIDAAMRSIAERKFDVSPKRAEITLPYMISGITDSYISWATGENEISLGEFCTLVSELTAACIAVMKA